MRPKPPSPALAGRGYGTALSTDGRAVFDLGEPEISLAPASGRVRGAGPGRFAIRNQQHACGSGGGRRDEKVVVVTRRLAAALAGDREGCDGLHGPSRQRPKQADGDRLFERNSVAALHRPSLVDITDAAAVGPAPRPSRQRWRARAHGGPWSTIPASPTLARCGTSASTNPPAMEVNVTGPADRHPGPSGHAWPAPEAKNRAPRTAS